MKFDDFEKLNGVERREFLKILSGVLSLPVFAATTKFSIFEMLMGKAYAQAAVQGPKLFLEVNLRDQWDFGCLFVPPSVARSYENVKSQIALFDAPIQERNNFFVTPLAQELRPHLDDIAVMEIGECVLPDGQSIHGHEAGNPLRSPGRSKNTAAGKKDMATADKRPGTGGNEILYSSSPTPLVLHNYYNKTITPTLTNGVLMRSSIRVGTHTYYHFEADLANAQVDRFFDRDTLLNRFNSAPAPALGTLQKHGPAVAKLLKKIDPAYLSRVVASATSQAQHASKLNALETSLGASAPTSTNLTLSAAELNFWTNGITGQLECPGDEASACRVVQGKWHVGELYGYASKLFRSGRVRSIGIDFDVHDVHSNRNPFLMNALAQQSGMPLARLIADLKAAGLWANTVIAMYTLDGSRSPLLNSTGDGTKNAVVLAGGGIKGGYYGDVKVENGQVTYYRPNDSGAPITGGTTGREMRVQAADVYKTVMHAAGIPMTLLDSFPDVRPGKLLSYMLKG